MDNVRVCHVGNDNKNRGGAFLITRRVDKVIRKYGYAFDYLSMDEFVETNETEWALLPDSRAYSCRIRKNRLFGYIILPFSVYSILKNNRYKIIHIDADTAWKALLYAIPSKLSGAKVVVHSHSAGPAGDYVALKKAAHTLCKPILALFTDKQLACSGKAGRWMFTKRSAGKTTVLLNGTDLDEFYFDEGVRKRWREKLEFTDELVIGNIGLICTRKNQEFLVKVLSALRSKGINAALLLVGDYDHGCDWKKRIMDLAEQEHVANNTVLYGFSKDTVELLNAMDVYVCPSLIEGAPLSVYEAQATGLPCVMSDTVSEDIIASGWIEVESLNSNPSVWSKKILDLHERFCDRRAMCKMDKKYGLEYMAKSLSTVYSELL